MEISTMSQAMQLHAQTLKSPNYPQRNLSKIFTFSALSPSGDLSYAQSLLTHSLLTLTQSNSYYHNTLIRAFSNCPNPTQSISLFLSFLNNPTRILSPWPDNFTFPFLFKSCSRLKMTQLGKQLHGSVLKSGFGSDLYVLNSIIHFYGNSGESGCAWKVFDEMPVRDVVSWTAMIDGLVDDNRPVEAIRLFDRMVAEGDVRVNEATVVSVLRACAETGALGVGKRVHGIVEEMGIGEKDNVRTALIDMYAKCGCIDRARRVFDEIEGKCDVFAWTAMIKALASHGQCEEAIEFFDKMVELKVKPDGKTMTAVLSACRNAGLVYEGCEYFSSIWEKYGIKPSIQHYGCMVDLLARAGHLSEAEELIEKLPFEPDGVMWRTLIWACKIHGDTDKGERLMEKIELLDTDEHDSGSYILVGNMYASAGKWQEKARVRDLMNQKRLSKPPGNSKIEVNGGIHEFTMGDSSHPEATDIFVKLDEIKEKLREEGYNPKVSEVLLEMDDEDKASQLWHHSEKLALAYGLIRTRPGTTIRVVKNLRSCEDCHEVMKLISKIYNREIIVRDRIRFHYFVNGTCSCKDYW
ncbi:hypothetical protein ACFE04_015609 [Oxalis oulophora]